MTPFFCSFLQPIQIRILFPSMYILYYKKKCRNVIFKLKLTLYTCRSYLSIFIAFIFYTWYYVHVPWFHYLHLWPLRFLRFCINHSEMFGWQIYINIELEKNRKNAIRNFHYFLVNADLMLTKSFSHSCSLGLLWPSKISFYVFYRIACKNAVNGIFF